MEPLLVVISCSSSPEDLALRDGLEKQLQSFVRQGGIRLWHSGHVRAGESIRGVTLHMIREARIIVPLISPDYLADDQHEHEMKTALARSREARVMPVMLRSCTLHGTALAPMKVLPDGGTPVNKWSLVDDAWASVARAVRTAADEIRAGKGHYVPLDVLRTAPMAPPASFQRPPSSHGSAAAEHSSRPTPVSPVSPAHHGAAPGSGRASAPFSSSPPVESAPRSSAVSVPPIAPVSAPPFAAPVIPVPPAAPSRPPPRRSPLHTIALLLAGAFLAALSWRGWSLLAEPSLNDPPRHSEAPSLLPPAPVTTAPSVCCGGVDCPESERNVTDSWCEKFPTYCSKCSSGRGRVEGACSRMLSGTALYKIRPGQALIGGKNALAGAKICLRRSGTAEQETCSTANEARAGKAKAHPFPISVHDLTAGTGVDFWIKQDGETVASETGALVNGGGLKAAALCAGVVLHGTRSPGDSVTIFLDQP